MRLNSPALTTELPVLKPLVVNVLVVGPFEEEEEGTGLTSDGASGKRKGFSLEAAVRHSQSARAVKGANRVHLMLGYNFENHFDAKIKRVEPAQPNVFQTNGLSWLSPFFWLIKIRINIWLIRLNPILTNSVCFKTSIMHETICG